MGYGRAGFRPPNVLSLVATGAVSAGLGPIRANFLNRSIYMVQPAVGGYPTITTIRFRMEATADHVTAGLLEAVRRTEPDLLSVAADGDRVYPFGARDPSEPASVWQAEVRSRDAGSERGSDLELFLHRAELILGSGDGIRVEGRLARPKSVKGAGRIRGAYGLDGSFLAANRIGSG
jgi:hypothetical protein